MADEEIDVLVVAGNPWRSDYLRFALDVTPIEGHAFAFLEREGPGRIIVEHPAEAARLRSEQPQLQVSWSPSPIAETETAIRALGGRRIALAPLAAVPHRLAIGPLGSSVIPTTALLDRLMLRKSSSEIDALRRAAALADQGYVAFCDAARLGRPEYALVADVEAFFRSRGCPENFQILGSGGREVRGMHAPTERRLVAGDLVTTELTPCVDGYYAQICRTLVLGDPSEDQKRSFSIFHEAQAAAQGFIKPGVNIKDVARVQNDVFRREGFGEYTGAKYTRVRGHNLGLYPDENPWVLEDVDCVVDKGMVVIAHPNTYLPLSGYMVFGDTLLVTDNGCIGLNHTAKRLFSKEA